MGPNDTPAGMTEVCGEVTMPSELHPEDMDIATRDEDTSFDMIGSSDASPTLPVEQGVTGGIAAWQNNKRITGLWSINQNRNSWVGVSGVGWKKLANNSDTAIVALTMLSAHAREKNSPVNYREEKDGMIREMYVW
jgi:hypothetical protein